jgi:hypothetical protein
LRLPLDTHTLPPVTTRLRALSEAEAYARCYGNSGEDVKVVRVPRRPRYQLEVSGEDLRAAFAQRLDRRDPELAEELEDDDEHLESERVELDSPVAEHFEGAAEPANGSASSEEAA